MKLKQTKRILETAWLIVAVLSGITLLHALITRGIVEAIPFFIIFVLASGIFYLRRQQRLRGTGRNK